MPNPDDGLTQQQGLQLIFEQTSARNLLGYGTRALRNSAFHDTTADPVMTMLSIGVEKLLKTGIGLSQVLSTRRWPDRDTMQNTYRHNLVTMDELLRAELGANIGRATHAFYVQQGLDSVETDPVWRPLLEALNRYGSMGRFYYLDALAESPQSEEPPSVFWDRAERAAIASDPDLTRLFHLAANEADAWHAFSTALNAKLAGSVERWWAALAMAGKQGVLGERGVLWGLDVGIDMVGTQVRSAD